MSRQKDEARRQEETQKLLNTLAGFSNVPGEGLPPSSSHSEDNPLNASCSSFPTTLALPPSEVIPALRTLQKRQNTVDAKMDLEDLRSSMRAAMQTGSDVAVVEMMQVEREGMPEAMKTLQRALERVVVREECVGEGDRGETERTGERMGELEDGEGDGRGDGDGGGGEGSERDTLDREFIETGIEALRRLSEGLEAMPLPSWTITRFVLFSPFPRHDHLTYIRCSRYEVFRHEKVGTGFFSDVYRGTWRGRTVAIKLLAKTTPRDLFLREVGIWAALRHPHVLRLFGASSASGDPPWFMVMPLERNGSLVQYLKGVEMVWGAGGAGAGHVRGGSGVGLGIGALPGPISVGRTRTASVPTWGTSPRQGEIGSRRRSAGACAGVVPREWDLYRFMHEIAKGMEYLHENEVLHGDLKVCVCRFSDR
jgi:hypothetical protein